MHIDIEDFFEDIIGKTMRGLGVSAGELAERSGVSKSKINALKDGQFDESAVRTVAPHLGIDAEALVISGKRAWYPEPVELDGLQIFNTPWHDMRVNAFLVWDPASKEAAAFDTGADASGMIKFVRDNALHLGAIYLTHTHGDHVADLLSLSESFGTPPVFVNRREPVDGAQLIEEGHRAEIGGLTLETLLTTGHSKGGQTYFIEGLARPVAVVGDALFSGSMGGGMVSFADALANNREKILTLPDETVVCPGHGPMSSVGEEKRHNPFFPEFK